MDPKIFTAFLFTLIAGLATGIGGLIALSVKKVSPRFLSMSLGLSAGVMIYVSFVEIFPGALAELTGHHGEKSGTILTVVGFFVGMGLIAAIDGLIPSDENPHEVVNPETYGADLKRTKTEKKAKSSSELMRTGVFTALALAIHNFPEGLATFMTALQDPQLAIPVVVAIAIHNIPEGIAVAVPIYYATNSRRKAFRLSFLSGLAEPLGAAIGYLILMPFLNATIQGLVNAGVAGIMVFISIDELLPSAEEYGEHHWSIGGFVVGMLIMAISLILFL